MMRSISLLLLLLFTAVAPVAAQDEATELDRMVVELWPDYDRPAMLVLLTGTLPATATLPATFSIPLPAEAEIHAIARFTEEDVLVSDVESTAGDGRLTLTSPGRTFRVEYYAPYTRDGNQTTYRFEWQSGLTIGDMSAIVQQPLAAADFAVVPAPGGSAANRGDGLNYHQIAGRPVAAGEPFTVEVSYTVAAPVLSAPAQPLPAATTTPAAAAGQALGGLSPWWLLAIPAVLALVAGAWYLGQQTGSGRARKPRPARADKPGSAPGRGAVGRGAVGRGTVDRGTVDRGAVGSGPAVFCHHCGQPAQPGDVFCRKCGTRLKQ